MLVSLAIACKFSFVCYVLVEKENCLDSSITSSQNDIHTLDTV